MKYTQTGKVVDGFYVVGNAPFPIYLMDGPVPVLFDAWLTGLCLNYAVDIRRVLGNRAPGYLFLTHSHFDHIGAAAYIKALFPYMKVAGSERTQEILQRDNAIELIRTLNQEAGQSLGPLSGESIYHGPFEPFDLDLKLSGGETIELDSNCHLKVMNTPGHTWDFMSYWVPEKRILIASEAAGCDDGSGYILTEFLVDYDAYVRSLRGLSQLDPDVLCQGHGLVFTGPDAHAHMHLSLEQAPRFLAMVEGFLEKEQGDIKRTVTRVKAVEWDPKPWPKQTESAYVINTQVRVGTIRKRIDLSRQEKCMK